MIYEPDMDVSPLLFPDEASYYQTIIGLMRWVVKLGHVDNAVEASHIHRSLPCHTRNTWYQPCTSYLT